MLHKPALLHGKHHFKWQSICQTRGYEIWVRSYFINGTRQHHWVAGCIRIYSYFASPPPRFSHCQRTEGINSDIHQHLTSPVNPRRYGPGAQSNRDPIVQQQRVPPQARSHYARRGEALCDSFQLFVCLLYCGASTMGRALRWAPESHLLYPEVIGFEGYEKCHLPNSLLREKWRIRAFISGFGCIINQVWVRVSFSPNAAI